MTQVAYHEGTAEHFIQEVGGELDDFSISRSADGKLGRERVLFRIHQAQVAMLQDLRARGAHPSQIARKVTLTEDSNNDDWYICPPRAIQVFAVEDSNGLQYTSYRDRRFFYRAGFIVERHLDAKTRKSRLAIHFMNYSPTGTIYAWVIEEPVRLSSGDGTYTATSLTLESTPDLGLNVLDDDYYIGAQAVVTETGSTALGLIQTCTDYDAGTLALTMGTWDTTPTANDNYAILCELPRVCWRMLALETVRRITRVDKRFGIMREDQMMELQECRESTIIALRNPAEGFDGMPRQVVKWVC